MSMWSDPYNPPYLVFDPQDFDNYWKSFQPKDGPLICKPKTNMKPQIALSIEQMQELHSLGMDCSDASMAWITTRLNDTRLALRPEASRLLYDHLLLKLEYAYTLEDILCKVAMKIDWVPRIEKPMKWQSYRFNRVSYADTPLEAAFIMLKYAIENHPDKIKKLER